MTRCELYHLNPDESLFSHNMLYHQMSSIDMYININQLPLYMKTVHWLLKSAEGMFGKHSFSFLLTNMIRHVPLKPLNGFEQ